MCSNTKKPAYDNNLLNYRKMGILGWLIRLPAVVSRPIPSPLYRYIVTA